MLISEMQTKIKEYDALVEKAKIEVVKAETQLQQLEEQKASLVTQLATYGLTIEQLPGAIQNLEAELEEAIKQLDVWAAEVKAVLG